MVNGARGRQLGCARTPDAIPSEAKVGAPSAGGGVTRVQEQC